MKDDPNIVGIAALIGNQARCAMLTALMAGQALTATELAAEANITKQTASSHLAKLQDAGLICVEQHGRHRYFRLAAQDVAVLLENLMGVAQRTGATRVRTGPREPALRKARVCYDHLAGDIGVAIYDAFLKQGYICVLESASDNKPVIELTQKGKEFMACLEIPVQLKTKSKRPICRPCLDWSVRRYHIAGVLGTSILNYCYLKKWAKRVEGSRVVHFFPMGEYKLRETFGILD